MPRLKMIEPSEATGKAKELFEGPLKGKELNLFKSMANSPAAVEAYLGMSQALGQGLLDAKQREAIALAVSEANGCDYCLAAHTAMGKNAGLSEQETVQARRGKMDDPKLNAVVRFAAALNEKKGWVDDEDVEAFREAGFNDGHVAEVVANYALNVFTNYFNHVNHSEPDFPKAPALGA